MTTDPGKWPLMVDEEYGSPYLMCDAYIKRVRVPGKPPWVVTCRAAITGDNLDEIRASVEQHIARTEHVERP